MRNYVRNPKEPIEIFIKVNDDLKALEHHICGECDYIKNSKQFAYDCCRQFVCEKCDKDTYQYQSLCSSCRDKANMDAREEIPSEGFEGPVYCEGSDRWFESYDEAIEHFQDLVGDEESYIPEFVLPAEKVRVPNIDAEDILENFCSDLFEDAQDHLNGTEELEAAIKKFNEANNTVFQWEQIPKKKIRLVIEKAT